MDWFTQLERRALGPSVLFVLFSFTPFRKRIGSAKKQIVRQNHFKLACHRCIGNRVELK